VVGVGVGVFVGVGVNTGILQLQDEMYCKLEKLPESMMASRHPQKVPVVLGK